MTFCSHIGFKHKSISSRGCSENQGNFILSGRHNYKYIHTQAYIHVCVLNGCNTSRVSCEYIYTVGSLFKTPGSYLINHKILSQGLIKRDPNKWHLPTPPGSLGALESMCGACYGTAEEEPEEEEANALSARLQARILCERSVVQAQKGVLPC
jgi:hypothetical protein